MWSKQKSKFQEEYIQTNPLPLILALDSGGIPLGWINYEECAIYYAKDKVLWSLGETEVKLHGGTNALTGKQSILVMDTIVAIHSEKSSAKHRHKSPHLTNRTLFERDRYLCAYCGGAFRRSDLSRDHVIPTSRGGTDCWENVVTSCWGCNGWKGNKTLDEADLKLLYVPYAPSFNEHLILQNRRILANQMDFLLKGVNKNSRLHEHAA